MKRTDLRTTPMSRGAVGFRRVSDYPDFQAAEVSGTIAGMDVATFRREIDDPFGVHQSDAELIADFTDFMQGDASFDDGTLAPPDPVFREKLRRRLWRTHVHVNLRDTGETH